MAMEAGRTPPGWWLASDGKWYAPELHPNYRPEASPNGTQGPGRRRATRQGAGWPGTYRFEGDPDGKWFDCQVLDISILGAGIEIFHPLHGDLVGRKVTVDAQASGSGSASIRFVGTIRDIRPGPSGGIRTGIAFSGLSEERLRVGW
jgi:hypothetical protein